MLSMMMGCLLHSSHAHPLLFQAVVVAIAVVSAPFLSLSWLPLTAQAPCWMVQYAKMSGYESSAAASLLPQSREDMAANPIAY